MIDNNMREMWVLQRLESFVIEEYLRDEMAKIFHGGIKMKAKKDEAVS